MSRCAKEEAAQADKVEVLTLVDGWVPPRGARLFDALSKFCRMKAKAGVGEKTLDHDQKVFVRVEIRSPGDNPPEN